MNIPKTIIMILVILFGSYSVYAQILERKRAVQDGPVDDIFLAGSIAGLSTVTALPQNNMNSMVTHSFGLVSGGIEDFYGLDGGASVRLGIDYGVTDKLDIGIGRTGSTEDVVDLRAKYVILEQLKSDKVPVQIAIKGDLGISTQKERRFDYTFTERLNYFTSVMVARKFNDKLSLQVAPMVSHFNTVVKEQNNGKLYNTIVGLGIAGRYKLNDRNALAFEYLPVLGNRNPNTKDHVAVSFEIDTGGHVFQLFFMNGQWFTEQHLLARTDTNILNLDFRFGFNINRFFGLGK
jgi:hypothetical protein